MSYMTFKRSIGIVFSSAWIATSALAAYDLPNVLAELEKKEKAVQVIKFDFKQEIFFTQMNSRSEVSGGAIFDNTGKFSIEKMSPDKQKTVSNGKKVWVYNPAYNQVWEGTASRWLNSSTIPKGLLPVGKYVSELRQNFILELIETTGVTGSAVGIHASPKHKALNYSMDIFVSTNSWLPLETVYQSDSAKVVTRLINTEVNPEISQSTFHFVAPRGADVIPLN